jgi:integrase
MVFLMAFCGLRVSELVGLDGTDLDLEGGRVRVKAQTSKGRRTRFVDLPLSISEGKEAVRPEIASTLVAWLETRNARFPHLAGEDPLFVTLSPGWGRRGADPEAGSQGNLLPAGRRVTTDAVRNILIRTARRVGVDPRLTTPHRLRHHFGLMSAKAGVPTTALMRAMGHRSPTMTARYSEFADSERRWAFARADITQGIRLPEVSG